MSIIKIETINTISAINHEQWNGLVQRSPLGSFFHTWEWLKAIEDGIHLLPFHIVIRKQGNLIGILPNFLGPIGGSPLNRIESTQPGFGGPVIVSDEKKVMDLMLDTVARWRSQGAVCHYMTTLNQGYVRYAQYLARRGYKVDLRSARFILDLRRKWAEIESDMNKSRRYNLRTARSRGIDVKKRNLSSHTLELFYETYEKAMRRVGACPYPIRFFNCLAKEIPDRIIIFSAFREGEEIGSYIYFLDNEQSSLHHFFAAVDQDAFKFYPNEILHERLIKWGQENGFEKYDFGGTQSDWRNGRFRFKQEFGGDPLPVLSWEKGLFRFSDPLLKWARRIVTH